MPQKLEVYKCNLCGNIAEVLAGGASYSETLVTPLPDLPPAKVISAPQGMKLISRVVGSM